VRPTSSDQTAVLIIRVWFEGDGSTELRARIVRIPDSFRTDNVSAVAAPEEIYTAVRAWVEELTLR
jgi:hypothetical protein